MYDVFLFYTFKFLIQGTPNELAPNVTTLRSHVEVANDF